MQKVLVVLALAVIISTPVPAQNYNKNFAECAKEVGFNPAKLHTKTVRWANGPPMVFS